MSMVPSNHAYVTGGDNIISRICQVLEHAAQVVEQTAEAASQQQLERMRTQAERDPRWREMAPDLNMWHEHGSYAYGVQNTSPNYEAAMAAEYGDATHPPAPLIRMGLLNGVTDMGWSMQEAFRQAGFG